MSIDSFEMVLRRLLSGFGIDVAESNDEDILLDPVEPLQKVPPHLWIRATALHLEDLRHGCKRIVSKFEKVAARDSSQEEVSDALWGIFEVTTIGDVRFHSFYFSLYGELIREMLINANDVYTSFPVDSLRPQVDEAHVASAIDFDQISQRLSQFSSLAAKELMVIRNDLCQLYIAARTAAAALELFMSSSQENASVLGRRFADGTVYSAHTCPCPITR